MDPFCTFNVIKGKPVYTITVSWSLAREVNLGKKCVLGYENNTIVIIPDENGNVTVTKGQAVRICARRFLQYLKLTPRGRYKAKVKDGKIIILLNEKVLTR